MADMKLDASAMSCPASTLSPLATFAAAGAPICCASGILTVSGSASTSTGRLLLNLFSDGWTPPIGNVFISRKRILRIGYFSSGFGAAGAAGLAAGAAVGLAAAGALGSLGRGSMPTRRMAPVGHSLTHLRQSLHFCGSM